MSQLLIRNLPEGVKEALRLKAAKSGHSMEAEARKIIADAVMLDSGSVVLEWVESAQKATQEDLEFELPERSVPRQVVGD